MTLYYSFLMGLFTFLQVKYFSDHGKALTGIWNCDFYRISIRVYPEGSKINANLLSFPCHHKIKKPLNEHFDFKNPDSNLRSRPWLHLPILTNLTFSQHNVWTKGKVYIPPLGLYANASIVLINDTTLQVKLYKGIQLLGTSMIFNKSKTEPVSRF